MHCISYNDQKGFGFIQPDNFEEDVFVHANRAGACRHQRSAGGPGGEVRQGIEQPSPRSRLPKAATQAAAFAEKGSPRGSDAQ